MYTNQSITKLEEYSPIKSLEEIAKDLGKPVKELLKLNGNENPYGTSDFVLNKLTNVVNLHLYPDPSSKELTQCIANYQNLIYDQVIVSAGSDEILELITKAFTNIGDTIVSVNPSFGMYKFLTELYNCNYVEVDLREKIDQENKLLYKFILPETEFFVAIKSAKIIFLARPNNPDGSMISLSIVEKICQTKVLVVVDEAYIEFTNLETAKTLLSSYPNLIILRTFSKLYGIAGLRLGYAMLHPEVKSVLMKIKQPYNVNIISQLLGQVIIENIDQYKSIRDKLVSTREEMKEKFLELATKFSLKIYDSEANFILVKFENKSIQNLVYKLLYDRGILVRKYSNQIIQSCLRFSLPKLEDLDYLFNILNKVMTEVYDIEKNE
jgi:histidinol-phosphate aminotransferase